MTYIIRSSTIRYIDNRRQQQQKKTATEDNSNRRQQQHETTATGDNNNRRQQQQKTTGDNSNRTRGKRKVVPYSSITLVFRQLIKIDIIYKATSPSETLGKFGCEVDKIRWFISAFWKWYSPQLQKKHLAAKLVVQYFHNNVHILHNQKWIFMIITQLKKYWRTEHFYA